MTKFKLGDSVRVRASVVHGVGGRVERESMVADGLVGTVTTIEYDANVVKDGAPHAKTECASGNLYTVTLASGGEEIACEHELE